MAPLRFAPLHLFLALSAAASRAHAQAIERISVASDGTPGNAASFDASVSDDGGLVAFGSVATNLVPNDTNGDADVFLRDRVAGTTKRVSVSTSGKQARGSSDHPRVCADGSFVVFASDAANLDSNDANGRTKDVFIHEIATAATTLVSVSTSNAAGNGPSSEPVVSQDGRYVAFTSYASNFAANDNNGTDDVFLRDRQAAATTRVSVTSSGAEGNATSSIPVISRDGRYVVFMSRATNLDSNDTDSIADVYLRDTVLGTTTLVSVDSTGVKGDADSYGRAITDDGRYVVFESIADNLVAGDTRNSWDVFVHDVVAGTTTCVIVDSDGNRPTNIEDSLEPSIAGDGRSVFFISKSGSLIDGDQNAAPDLFCRDLTLSMTTRQSVAANGDESDQGAAMAPSSCSQDGRFVTFSSTSTNLVAGGSTTSHVYLRDRNLQAAYWSNYGTGHAGTHGVPSLTASASPRLNQTAGFVIENSWRKWTDALILIGTEQVQWPTAWGGDLLVNPNVAQLVALAPGGMTLDDRIPPDEFLVGVAVYGQVLELDPGASDSISFSPGIELVFGF